MSKTLKNRHKNKLKTNDIDDWSDDTPTEEMKKPEVATSTATVWSNELVTPIEEVLIQVPEAISLAMRTIHQQYEDVEFSILTNSIFDKEKNIFIVSEDFYIPKQKVSRVSIHYTEDMSHKYNTVIHKHPDGCNNFSGQDDKYINSNFGFSLLWMNFEFIKGICNLDTPYGSLRVRLPLKIEELYNTVDIEENLMINIEKETEEEKKEMIPSRNFSEFYGSHYGGFGHHNQYLYDMVSPNKQNNKRYEMYNNNEDIYVDSEGNVYRDSDFDTVEDLLPGSALATMDEKEME